MILSVVIPLFNESQSVEAVVRSHVDAMGQAGLKWDEWEILCLDDASTDGTWAILEQLKGSIPQLRFIRHASNQGIAVSFQDLFLDARGEYIYATGGDGQWPANNVLVLWRQVIESRVDLVIGVRKNRGAVYGAWRKALSYGFNALTRLLFSVDLKDINGIKLGRREIFRTPVLSRSFFAEIERVLLARARGIKIGFADVDFLPRAGGKARGAKLGNVVATLSDMFRFWTLSLMKGR